MNQKITGMETEFEKYANMALHYSIHDPNSHFYCISLVYLLIKYCLSLVLSINHQFKIRFNSCYY